MKLDYQVSLGTYRCPRTPDEPMLLHLVHVPAQPGRGTARERFRAGREQLLAMTFEELEAQVRDELTRMLGPGGVEAERDIAGVIVNRWGHGYSYFGDPLSGESVDPPPYEIARAGSGTSRSRTPTPAGPRSRTQRSTRPIGPWGSCSARGEFSAGPRPGLRVALAEQASREASRSTSARATNARRLRHGPSSRRSRARKRDRVTGSARPHLEPVGDAHEPFGVDDRRRGLARRRLRRSVVGLVPPLEE